MTKEVGLDIRLTPWQERVDASEKRFTMLRCGRKTGKTTYALYRMLKGLGKPNSYVQFIAPTTSQGKDIAWRELKRMIPPKLLKKKPNETELTAELINNSFAQIIGSENADAIRGTNPTGVIMEEAAFHKRDVWHEVVRPNLTAKNAWALFIFTPKGMNWVWELERDAKEKEDWQVFHHTFYDNPYISDDEKASARRDCKNEIEWRQEYMAEYEAQGGRVFTEFDESIHLHHLDVPKTGTVYRGIDWGLRDNTVCLWGEIKHGSLFVYDMHMAKDLPATTQARAILSKTDKNLNVEGNFLSHDAFKQDVELKRANVATAFAQAGMRPLQMSSRHKTAGIDLMKLLFSQNRIAIDAVRCRPLVTQLLAYEWRDTAFEKTSDGNDDTVDALRYLVQGVEPILRRMGVDTTATIDKATSGIISPHRLTLPEGNGEAEEQLETWLR